MINDILNKLWPKNDIFSKLWPDPNKDNVITITEEQMIDLDKYHVKVLTDTEQTMLKQYMDTQPKNTEAVFSFFSDIYDKIPQIILCLHDSFEENLNDIINNNIISIIIPSIRKCNNHIIESHPKSVYEKNLIYDKRVTMLFPIIEEYCTFSFHFKHINMENYLDKDISTFGLNKCSNTQYNIDNTKVSNKIISYLEKQKEL